MLKKERHNFIIKQINLRNKVLLTELSEKLGVSEDTVRRDLTELADEGKLIKVHGGALSKSYHLSSMSDGIYALNEKKAVAWKAAKLIKDGMNVLTGGGTTVIETIKNIPLSVKATLFTISPLVALELANHNNLQVILIGGRFSRDARVTMGSQVTNYLSEIRVDICFLGANDLSAETGVTDSDIEAVQLKKSMIASANKLVILAISERLKSENRIRVCDNTQIHTLITELEPTDEILKGFDQAGIKIL
ncbi:MAG TPA: DeoR/GlpR family DNA-binding transcription regulator [Sphingobacteriaceae bacterium]